jgi:DNA-binding response OmpR family regulator
MSEAPRLLIVEDETTTREYLARAFEELGYDVLVASGGREAIGAGARFRPDVLIADWMLRNHYHGLDVCEVLGQVNPKLRTILVTGFPSRDLVEDAEQARVYRFLQKPFELDDLEDAVRAALSEPTPRAPAPALGIVEVGPDGAIRFANDRARHLFSYTHAGRTAANLNEILPDAVASDLDRATSDWLAVRPLAPSSVKWLLRAGRAEEDGSRLVLLRNRRDRIVGQPQLVEALLGVEDERHPRWPYRGAVLVVEADRAIRRTCVRLLRNSGATAYGVTTRADAARFLGHDRSLRYLVLDWESDGSVGLPELMARVASERPDVCVVGTAAEARADDFRRLGVAVFLQKPWALRSLINALREHER